MKFNLMVAFLFSITATAVFGQEIKYVNLATAERGEYTSYLGSDGAVYKVGDRVKIGVPSSNKTFAFITEGDGILLPITNLLASSSGTETEIKRISLSLVISVQVIPYHSELKGLQDYPIIPSNLKTPYRQVK